MIAIDLGSNSLRIFVYDCDRQKEIFSETTTVKTADGLVQNGYINDGAVRRVITAIHRAKKKVDFTAYPIKAVTTEALRRATNAIEVLANIEKQTDVSFEIISAKEEARLTLLAVKNRLSKLHHKIESFVVVDIGGGSTEIIYAYPDEIISRSFPVGIVTIAQKYETLENIEKELPSEMLAMQMFCAEINATKDEPNSFVATAGTPTTVAAMKLGLNYENYDAKKINGTLLEYDELDFYLKKLLSMTEKKREEAVGTERSDLIMTGILIYKALYKMLGFDRCIVIDDGLREGVALDFCRIEEG